MRTLKECFDANRAWSAEIRSKDPGFFERLRHQQEPELLWIGCSDSRLPPDRIIQKPPGTVFVHRNVANVVVHTDLNCLSVLQYGIEALRIENVIVCGHYGCGGVRAALQDNSLGLIDNWLGHIRDVYAMHREELDAIGELDKRIDRLCEMNVIAQVANVARTTVVQSAWRNGRKLAIHGWVYSVADGLLHDLGVVVERPSEIPSLYRAP